MRLRSFIIAVFIAVVFPIPAFQVEALVWKTEGLVEAEPISGSQNLSLSVNSSGNPHLGYLGNKFSVFDSTAWHFEKVVGEATYTGTSDYGSLAVDPGGDIHIVYRIRANNDIYYARYDGSQWSFIGGAGDGLPKALALDNSNLPHVAVDYYQSSYYKTYDGNTWHSEGLEFSTTDTSWSSEDIKLDSNAHPHMIAVARISETPFPKTSSKILYARHNGSDWIKEYIIFPDSVVQCAGLALNNDDEPHLVIYEIGVGFKHFFKVGPSWQSTLIDAGVTSGQYTNISIKSDPEDNLHVAYNKLSLIRYGFYNGTWNVETVDDVLATGEPVALDVDDQGRVHITYLENAGYGLKYARSISEIYPETSFSISPIEGQAPLTVQFTNNTTGIVDSWLWDFGDGTTSTESSPLHTYTKAGLYTVTLSVDGPYGMDSFTEPNAIWVYELPLNMNYMVTIGEQDHYTAPPQNRISIVKKGSNEVSGFIPLPDFPFGISSTQMGEHTYTSIYHDGLVHKYPRLYQIPKAYPTKFVEFQGMTGPNGIMTAGDNHYCYVARSASIGAIYRIDNILNTASSIDLQGNLWEFGPTKIVAVTNDNKKVFAAPGSFRLASAAAVADVIPHVKNANTEQYTVEPVNIKKAVAASGSIAIAPNNREVFIGSSLPALNEYFVVRMPIAPLDRYLFAESAYNGLTAFDMEVANLRAKNMVNIPINSDPHRIAVSPDGRWVYVTMRSNSVAIIDTSTNLVVKNVAVSINPRDVDFSPDGLLAYVGCLYYLVVIDTTSKSVIDNIPLSSTNQWGYAVDVIPIPSVCTGDLDEDVDVDGGDLALGIEDGGLIISQFATEFGRTNCP